MAVKKKIFKYKFISAISVQRGATIIELLAAISIFALVMTAIADIFITSLKQQRMMAAKQITIDNSRYIMEFMSKELRMAGADPDNPDLSFRVDDVTSLKSANSPSNTIIFINSAGDAIKYYLSGQRIYRSDLTTVTTADDDQPVSSAEARIEKFSISANDWDLTSGPSPRFTVLLRAERASSFSQSASVELQTTISPRFY